MYLYQNETDVAKRTHVKEYTLMTSNKMRLDDILFPIPRENTFTPEFFNCIVFFVFSGLLDLLKEIIKAYFRTQYL